MASVTKKGITSLIVAAVFAVVVIGSFSTAHAALKGSTLSTGSSFWSLFGVFGWGSSSASVSPSSGSNLNSVLIRIH